MVASWQRRHLAYRAPAMRLQSFKLENTFQNNIEFKEVFWFSDRRVKTSLFLPFLGNCFKIGRKGNLRNITSTVGRKD